MGLPPANLVLFFLSAFVGLWGISVIVRGLRVRRDWSSRVCPECGTDMLGVEGLRCEGCRFKAECETDLSPRVHHPRAVAAGGIATVAGIALLPLAMWGRDWETSGGYVEPGVHPLHAVFWGVACFGLVLGFWGIRGDRSRGRRRCPKCWYDMGGARTEEETDASLICPECGRDACTERRLYRPRRRYALVLIGILLITAGIAGQTTPRAMREGPVGLVPTTVLIAGMDWLPEQWLEMGPTGSLSKRLNHDAWVWQRRWSGRRAVRLLEAGQSVERFALLADVASVDKLTWRNGGWDEISAASLRGLVAAILRPDTDWEAMDSRAFETALSWAQWFGSREWASGDSPEAIVVSWRHVERNAAPLCALISRDHPRRTLIVLSLLTNAGVGVPQVVDVAVEMLSADDEYVRRQAAALLVMQAEQIPDAESLFLDLLRDGSEVSRQTMALYMGWYLEQTDAAPVLHAELERLMRRDASEEVAAAAGLALMRLAGRREDELLASWSSDPNVRHGVRLRMLESGGRWFDDSTELLRFVWPVVRDGTATDADGVLSQLHNYPWESARARDELVSGLEGLAGDTRPGVAVAARSLLEQIEQMAELTQGRTDW